MPDSQHKARVVVMLAALMLATVMLAEVYNDAHDVATYIIVRSVYNTVYSTVYRLVVIWSFHRLGTLSENRRKT